MVSAGAANKKAFGIDRVTNPWADMIGTEVIRGGRIERRRMLADHHQPFPLQAREQGARIIIRDPRLTGGAHLRPVPAGEAGPRCGAVCRRAADLDRTRLIDGAFIDEQTTGFDAVAAYCRDWTLERTASVTECLHER